MLLIDIHQLDVVLAQPIGLAVLKHEIDNIWRIFRLESEDVLVLCGSQDLGERGQVDAERDVAIAAEGREGFGFEHHRDESDVGIVHGLESNAGVVAVEIAVLHEVFDGIDDLP